MGMEEMRSGTTATYRRLEDDYSRWLYEKRVMWSLTGEMSYMDAVTDSILDGDSIRELMKRAYEVRDKLVIRGAGNDYWVLKRRYPELNFCLFVDNDATKQHRNIDGRQVISPEEFYQNYKDYYVLVNSMAANGEIVSELQANGISEHQILNLAHCYEDVCDRQYFETDIMKKTDNEVFVDGGCYDGRTIRQFVQWCGGDYKKIYSFEPDSNNFVMAQKCLNENPLSNVTLIKKGLWKESTRLHFSNNGTQGERIVEDGGSVIETTTVDEAVDGECVTFLKLDVEGAEYNALIGAKHTITQWHPKLAISIYHKPEDIFELPKLILSMSDDYRFWLRHYQLSPNETILYAV